MSEQTWSVAEIVKHVFDPLRQRAINGDLAAAIELVAAAKMLCYAVEDFRCAQPEMARQIARKTDVWPAGVARHVAAKNGLETALEELELGAAHPDAALVAPEGKAPDLDRPYNSVALEIRDFLLRVRRILPEKNPEAVRIYQLHPLSPDSFEEWWQVGWDMFLLAHNNDPFSDPRLRQHQSSATSAANREGVTVDTYLGRKVRQSARQLWIPRQ